MNRGSYPLIKKKWPVKILKDPVAIFGYQKWLVYNYGEEPHLS